jgi:hypothetical protein
MCLSGRGLVVGSYESLSKGVGDMQLRALMVGVTW